MLDRVDKVYSNLGILGTWPPIFALVDERIVVIKLSKFFLLSFLPLGVSVLFVEHDGLLMVTWYLYAEHVYGRVALTFHD